MDLHLRPVVYKTTALLTELQKQLVAGHGVEPCSDGYEPSVEAVLLTCE